MSPCAPRVVLVALSLLCIVFASVSGRRPGHSSPALPFPSSFDLKCKPSLFAEAPSLSQPSTATRLHRLVSIAGGSTMEQPTKDAPSGDSTAAAAKDSRATAVKRTVLCLWGVAQVVSVLANAIKRLLPIALQPLQQNDLSAPQWALYVAWCAYMVYAEGYRAFQQKFSPMVVDRAYGIVDRANVFNTLLAGPYAMGLFGAEKKRMIVSWAITAGVFSLVKVVKYLPYPYRSIVDGGVVCGLSYGAVSIVVLTVKKLLLRAPDADAEKKAA